MVIVGTSQGAQSDGFIAHMLLWEKSLSLHWLLPDYSIRLAYPFYTATIQPLKKPKSEKVGVEVFARARSTVRRAT